METEVVVQPSPHPLVRLKCLRVPARAVEREHELREEALAVRVLCDERLQLANSGLVASERELGVEAELVRVEPELLEAVGLAPSGRCESDVRERRTTPHRERGACQLDDVSVLVHRRCEAGLLVRLHELPRIQRGVPELECVARTLARESRSALVEELPQAGDVRLERVCRRRRRVVAPDLVDQSLDGHYLARPQ